MEKEYVGECCMIHFSPPPQWQYLTKMDGVDNNLYIYSTPGENSGDNWIVATYDVSEISMLKEVISLVMKYKPEDSDDFK